MNDQDPTAAPPSPTDPAPDRCKPVPPQIADTLALLHILLVYARHLALTLEHRSGAWGFSVIAQFFGTPRVPLILARVSRGIRRIQALQHVLLARARRGRDLAFLPPLPPRPRAVAPAAQAATGQPPARPAPPPAPRRRLDADAAPDPAALPSLAQLVAEVRRHPVGRTIADICLDLGVSPLLCDRRLWVVLFDSLTWYRGNLPRYMRHLRRRESEFAPQMGADPPLQLPADTAQGIRRMLGFLIGAQWPVLPDPQAASPAAPGRPP